MNKNKKSFSFTIKMTENKQYNVIAKVLFYIVNSSIQIEKRKLYSLTK